MEKEEMLSHLLDAYPYPVVFVDDKHIIRYLNKRAKYHYYDERGYGELVGRSMFDLHSSPRAVEVIRSAEEKFRNGGTDIFLSVNNRNERVYITPIRDDEGRFIGYFERFELNLQK